MDKFKKQIKRSYEGHGSGVTIDWKEESDKLFGPEEARAVYREMLEDGIVPAPEKDMVFVSPTANVPTHETAIFEEDQKVRKGQGLFLVGDMSELALESSQVRKSAEHGAFQYVRWDAEQLPLRENSVDIIWDRKGWLWYAARSGNVKRFFSSLKQYHSLLKPGGCVIIDNIYAFQDAAIELPISRILKIFVLFSLAKVGIRKMRTKDLFNDQYVDEYEPSTTYMIGELGGKTNMPIWSEIRDLFEFSSIGKNSGQMLVMKKKT